jgi:hypothetical protein
MIEKPSALPTMATPCPKRTEPMPQRMPKPMAYSLEDVGDSLYTFMGSSTEKKTRIHGANTLWEAKGDGMGETETGKRGVLRREKGFLSIGVSMYDNCDAGEKRRGGML